VKYFYDTEFYEDGERIHLISIGIVAEDGRELYLENREFNWKMVPEDHWIQKNVRPHLTGQDVYTRSTIAASVKNFICNNPTDWRANHLYGYYVAYDHVVLAQLFGRMVDMPRGMPWFSFDLQQMIASDPHRLGNAADAVKQGGSQHHALDDARWNKDLYEYIINRSQGVY
jgi:hypothetical protein